MVRKTVQWLRTRRSWAVVAMVALIVPLWAAGVAGANPGLRPLLEGVAPDVINYQGIVKVGDDPYEGTGYFKFAIVDVSTGDHKNYWANDGTASGEPSSAVPLTVVDGLFNVLLGDTSLSGMTESLDDSNFPHDPTYLRVWFSEDGGSFEALEPNQRLASVPYAILAEYAENGPTGPTGATGPSGPSGATGPSGPSGPPSGIEWDTLSGVSFYVGDGIETITSISVDFPEHGYVFVLGTCYLTGSAEQCRLGIGNTDYDMDILVKEKGDDGYVPAAVSYVYSGSAGTHEYYLLGEAVLGYPASCTAYDCQLTGIFLANRY
jgi:hypothetical protein